MVIKSNYIINLFSCLIYALSFEPNCYFSLFNVLILIFIRLLLLIPLKKYYHINGKI